MTEQDYRADTTPGLPLQPAAIPAVPAGAPAGAITAPPAVPPVASAPAMPTTQPAPLVPAAPVATPAVTTPQADDAPAAEVDNEQGVADQGVAEEPAAEEVAAKPAAASRPASASRKARRPAGGARKVTRYTLDLETQQHLFLRMFAISNGCEASKVMRGLLFLLEAGNELPAGVTLADLVLDEIFADEEAADA